MNGSAVEDVVLNILLRATSNLSAVLANDTRALTAFQADVAASNAKALDALALPGSTGAGASAAADQANSVRAVTAALGSEATATDVATASSKELLNTKRLLVAQTLEEQAALKGSAAAAKLAGETYKATADQQARLLSLGAETASVSAARNRALVAESVAGNAATTGPQVSAQATAARAMVQQMKDFDAQRAVDTQLARDSMAARAQATSAMVAETAAGVDRVATLQEEIAALTATTNGERMLALARADAAGAGATGENVDKRALAMIAANTGQYEQEARAIAATEAAQAAAVTTTDVATVAVDRNTAALAENEAAVARSTAGYFEYVVATRAAGLGSEVSSAAFLVSKGNLELLALAAGVIALKSFSDFELEIQRLGGNTGATTQQLGYLEKEILSLGTDGAGSLEDLATAYRHASDEGYRMAAGTELIKAAQEGVLATGGNLADITNSEAVAMHNWHDPASQAVTVLGQLLVASQQGNETLPDLVSHMGRVSAVAAGIHMPMADLVSLLSEFTKATGNPSLAETWANSLITHVINPTGTARKEMLLLQQTTGVDLPRAFQQFSNGQISFLTLMQEVHAATNGNVQATETLFGGIRGGAGAVQLLDGGLADYQSTLSKTADGADKLNKAASAGADTLSHKWNVAVGVAHVGLIDLGRAINSVFDNPADLGTLKDQLAPVATGVDNLAKSYFGVINPSTQVNGSLDEQKRKLEALVAEYPHAASYAFQLQTVLAEEAKRHDAAAAAALKHAAALQALNTQNYYSSGGGNSTPSALRASAASPETGTQIQSDYTTSKAAYLNALLEQLSDRSKGLTGAFKLDQDAVDKARATYEKNAAVVDKANGIIDAYNTKVKAASQPYDAQTQWQKTLTDAERVAANEFQKTGAVLPSTQAKITATNDKLTEFQKAIAAATKPPDALSAEQTKLSAATSAAYNDLGKFGHILPQHAAEIVTDTDKINAMQKAVSDLTVTLKDDTYQRDLAAAQKAQTDASDRLTEAELHHKGSVDALQVVYDKATAKVTALTNAHDLATGSTDQWTLALQAAQKAATDAQDEYLRDKNILHEHGAALDAARQKMLSANDALDKLQQAASSASAYLLGLGHPEHGSETNTELTGRGSGANPRDRGKAGLPGSENGSELIPAPINNPTPPFNFGGNPGGGYSYGGSHFGIPSPAAIASLSTPTAVTQAFNDAMTKLTTDIATHSGNVNADTQAAIAARAATVAWTTAQIAADAATGQWADALSGRMTQSTQAYNDAMGHLTIDLHDHSGNVAADVAAVAAATSATDSWADAQIKADIATGQWADALTAVTQKSTQAYNDALGKLTIDLHDHTGNVNADTQAAIASRQATDAWTQAQWDATFASASAATQQKMLTSLVSDMVSRANSVQSSQDAVDNANLALIADRSAIAVAAIQAMTTAIGDQTAILQAVATVQSTIAGGRVTDIQDQTAVMQAIDAKATALISSQANIRDDINKGDAAKLSLDTQIQTAQQKSADIAIQLARAQQAMDRADTASQLAVARDALKLAQDKAAADARAAAWQQRLLSDALTVDQDKLQLALDQQALEAAQLVVLESINSALTGVDQYGQQIQGLLDAIQKDNKQIAADQKTQANDQAGANQSAAVAAQQQAYDAQQSAQDTVFGNEVKQQYQEVIANLQQQKAQQDDIISSLQATVSALQSNTASLQQQIAQYQEVLDIYRKAISMAQDPGLQRGDVSGVNTAEMFRTWGAVGNAQ